MANMIKQKTYPQALHMYQVEYRDGRVRTLYGCGMTHIFAMSREYWPGEDIMEIRQLDDSWKN